MPEPSILNRLAALDTNAVSDALDFLQLKGATYGLRPLWNCPKIVGRASTVKVGPKTDNTATAHPFTTVIDAVTSDDRILVISGGLEGVSCWGTLLPMPRRKKVSVGLSLMACAVISTAARKSDTLFTAAT